MRLGIRRRHRLHCRQVRTYHDLNWALCLIRTDRDGRKLNSISNVPGMPTCLMVVLWFNESSRHSRRRKLSSNCQGYFRLEGIDIIVPQHQPSWLVSQHEEREKNGQAQAPPPYPISPSSPSFPHSFLFVSSLSSNPHHPQHPQLRGDGQPSETFPSKPGPSTNS